MDASVNSSPLRVPPADCPQRPQLVIHGLLASRILFNLRQSFESETEIMDGIFPLAHMHRRLPSAATTVRDSTLIDPHEYDKAKGQYS